MIRNRFVILVLSVFVCVTAYSQTQEGYVKTIGRPEKKGVALSGVSIKVKGEHNPVLSKNDGTFSMLLKNKKNGDLYSLQEVRKNGYELNEANVIGRQYAFSDRVPLPIVMVSSSQLQADKQRIENNAFKIAEKNYKAKLALLEEQKEKDSITIEKYREELLDLQDKFERYQSLIDGLAEHYAHVDYDELNDKEREINICIENGELERADSLIKTLFDPIDVLKRNKEALAQLNQQISEANNIIDRANEDMAAVLKQQERDAEHLYQLYTIAMSRFDNDKARFYIETRAELDTTNVDWQIDAGNFNNYIASFDKALFYFNRSLQLTQNGDYGGSLISICFEKIADVFFAKGDFSSSEKFYEDALVWRRSVDGEHSIGIAGIYQGLARLYSRKEEYQKASDYYNISSKIYLATQKIYNNDFAVLLLSMGESLKQVKDYKNATESALMSIKILTELGNQKNNIASAFILLGEISRLQGDFVEAINWDNKALELSQELWGSSHPFIANAYSEIGLVYSDQGNYSKAMEYHKKSLEIHVKIFGKESIGLAADYNNIAICHSNMKQYSLAIEYFNKALNAYKYIYGDTHSIVARVLKNMGMTYEKTENYHNALSCYLKALPIFKKYLGQDHPLVVDLYNLVAYSYCNIDDPIRALNYYKVALNICKRIYNKNAPNMIALEYNNLYYTYMAIIDRSETEQYLAEFREFMSEMVFVGAVVDNYPAYDQGLRGEYFLLEYNNWTQESHKSLFKYIETLRGKPKCLVLLKEGKISVYNFDDIAGMQISIKHIERGEKKKIEELYNKWKKGDNY